MVMPWYFFLLSIFLSFGIFIIKKLYEFTFNWNNHFCHCLFVFKLVCKNKLKKKIALIIKKILVYLSLILAAIFTIGGKFLFSLPFLFVILSGLKIKGLTALQVLQLWRLIKFLKNSRKFSQSQFNQPQGSTNISNDEAYKLLGLTKGCSKEEVLRAANNLQKNTSRHEQR